MGSNLGELLLREKVLTPDQLKSGLEVQKEKNTVLPRAMFDPTDLEVIEDIRFRTGLSIQPVIASESGILNAINKYYGSSSSLRVKKIIEDIALADDTRVNIIEEEKEDYDVQELVQATEEAPIYK